MDNQNLDKLISDSQSGNAQQRRAASYNLGKFKDPKAISALILAYDDEDSSVRQNSINGLNYIGSKDALNFLASRGIVVSELPKIKSYSEASIPWRELKIGIVAFLLGPALLLAIEPINELIKLFTGSYENYNESIHVIVSFLYGLGIMIALGLGIIKVLKSRQAIEPKKARSIAFIGIALTLLGFFCSPIALLIILKIVPCLFGC